MNQNFIKSHKNIVLMGAGGILDTYLPAISKVFDVAYITDNDPLKQKKYQNFRFTSPDDLHRIENAFVIVTTSLDNYRSIDQQLALKNIPHCLLASIERFPVDFPMAQLSQIERTWHDRYGNSIIIDEKCNFSRDAWVLFGRHWGGDAFSVKARNNHLHIGAYTSMNGACTFMFMGNGSEIHIGAGNGIGNCNLSISEGSSFRTGERCNFGGFSATIYEEGKIDIGNDCMFSHAIQLWQTDTHPIFDATTGERLNLSHNINIGNHVWVGTNAFIMAGARISNDCIVGANAVTSGQFEPNTIIAGNPARVVRKGVTWRKDELCLSRIRHISDCSPLL